jgi:plasmid stabilization system protein ParE
MAIRIKADDRVSNAVGDEEIYLPGVVKGADEEGPYEFVFPRVGRLIRLQRRLRGLNMVDAAAREIEGMLDWLAAGFGPDAWAHIDARLADDGDLLDEEHMVKLFQLLNEGETGRPTTSSNGASRQPWKNSSTAAPLQVVSGSEN